MARKKKNEVNGEGATSEGVGRRLILCVTDKGGVGKSTIMGEVVQYLKNHPTKPSIQCYDPDEANQSLAQMHPDVTKPLKIVDLHAIDEIAKCLVDFQVSLSDGLGSQQGKTFIPWIEDVGLLNDIAPQLGIDVTFIVVVEDDKEVITQTKKVWETYSDQVDWVLVKNHKQSSRFDLWGESHTRAIMLEADNVVEINFEKIHDKYARQIKEHNWSVQKLVDEGFGDILDRSRNRKMVQRIHSELDKVERFLLPSIPS